MAIPIALQLYTVREALASDFTRTMEKVAEMGYLGVETAGFPGISPQAAGQIFKELGLEVPGAHLPLPLGPRKNEVLDTLAAIDCNRAICAYQPEEAFRSLDELRRVCEALNEAQAILKASGYGFGYHNHWWEFEMLGDRPAHEVMRAYLHPEIFFEIDTYWVQTAGQDPAEVVRDLGPRGPLLHIKDGPAVKGEPMVPVGQGVMDFHPIVAAAEGNTGWLIVELDSASMDIFEAVEQSYLYMTEKGLAYGRED